VERQSAQKQEKLESGEALGRVGGGWEAGRLGSHRGAWQDPRTVVWVYTTCVAYHLPPTAYRLALTALHVPRVAAVLPALLVLLCTAELNVYKSNLIKESIRMGHNELGDFFYARGDLQVGLRLGRRRGQQGLAGGSGGLVSG